MPTTSQSVRSIFDRAAEIPSSAERLAYLNEVCAGMADIRQQVEALLAAHSAAGSFLDTPASALASSIEQLRAPAHDVPSLSFLAPSIKPGSLGRLGHYEILEVVGSGGMGIVLKAYDEKLQRVVAIKVISAELAASPAARRRFIREARACAAVRDEHVIGIHAVEDANQPPYLVMDFISGQSLQQRIDEGGPLAPSEILRIGMQMAAGLAAAHVQGLIHRDVKPANILLENGVQRVKITDFGLARLIDDASVTQTGVVAGTPQYMSPEQAQGEMVDHRTDLFSLGSVLYAMCVGHAPFRGSTTVAVLRRVIDESPRPIPETNPDIPDQLVAIIDRLLAKQPAERFQSATEVAELLGKELAHLQQPAAERTVVAMPPQPRQGSRLPWAAAALVLAIAAALTLTEITGITHLLAALYRTPRQDKDAVTKVEVYPVKPTTQTPASLPAKAAPLPTQAQAPEATEPAQAFGVLGSPGVPEVKFSTLAEAVLNSNDGDTIEIRGNGPFLSPPLQIGNRALTIRAGEGFHPVIALSREGIQANKPLLETYAALILEGLEIQKIGPATTNSVGIVIVFGASVHVANCRFVVNANNAVCIHGEQSPLCEVWNCAFMGQSRNALGWVCPVEGSLKIENCLQTGGSGVTFYCRRADHHDIRIHATHNTFAGDRAFTFYPRAPHDSSGLPDKPAKPIRVQAENNVFDTQSCIFRIGQNQDFLAKSQPLSSDQALTLLHRLVEWSERHNLYPSKRALMDMFIQGQPPDVVIDAAHALQWQEFWKQADVSFVSGQTRYASGDIHAKAASTPAQLLPSEFALRPDCAGYRAGPDGKDAGADVTLVGPGKAYERWKQTAAYQEWLKETKQTK